MVKQATKAVAKAADLGEEVSPVAGDSPLARLSRELAARFPDTMARRYVLPRNVTDCREVFMREITSRDEVEAAIMADATMSLAEKQSVRLTADAERRECIRLAIVALGKLVDKRDPLSQVVYEHVNHDGEPFSEINDWKGKTWTCLQTYFGMLNGVPTEELAEGLVGAQTVGAFAPPTSAIRASAESGK